MIPRAIHHRRKRKAPVVPRQFDDDFSEHRSPYSHTHPRSRSFDLDRRDSEASSANDFFFASLEEESVTNESLAPVRRSLHGSLLSTGEAEQCLLELNAVFGPTKTDETSSRTQQFTNSVPEKDFDFENASLSRRTMSDLGMTRPLKSSLKSSSSLKSFPSPTMKPTVSFSKLDIREYGIALSDHPSCSCGPPIQLGWNYSETKDLKLEEYETIRSSLRSEKREDMLLSYDTRDYLLREVAGCSKDEIERSIQEVERVKRNRLITDIWMPANLLSEKITDVVHHMSHIFSAHR
ncbi:hypothetical protein FisN_6Hh301 [Fistulifera solaris]|uniref:Uncharacterized protein n=1 Tax=Fistulifera solaris TaxID=1519565 RepID=A0A1Z5K739_FISSO|nr:hypothetical protein FisN_6Hh301 [Fistulifera solaris]|eukprot:GAX22054.1 hypothetical protein FisN_6Hh301 [Fistulifera solaris]